MKNNDIIVFFKNGIVEDSEIIEEQLNRESEEYISDMIKFCEDRTNKEYDFNETNLPKNWKDFSIRFLNIEYYEMLAELLMNDFEQGAIRGNGKGLNKSLTVIIKPKENSIFIIHCSKLDGLSKEKDELKRINTLISKKGLIRFIKLKILDDNIVVKVWERDKSNKFSEFVGIDSIDWEEWGDITFKLKDRELPFLAIKYEIEHEKLLNCLLSNLITLDYRYNTLKINNSEYEVLEIISKANNQKYSDIKKFHNHLVENYYNVSSKLKEKINNTYQKLSGYSLKKIKEYTEYIQIPDECNFDKYQKVNKKIEDNDIFVLCAYEHNGKIEIDEGFAKELLESLKKSINDKSKIKMLHILEKYLLCPLEFKHFLIYNDLSISLPISSLNKYNDLIEHLENEYIDYKNDIIAQNLCLLTILTIYKHIFADTNFEIWFNKLIEKHLESLNCDSKFLSYESAKIEFKRGDWWKNKKDFLNNKLKNELSKKMDGINVPIFIFFVGFDEQAKTVFSASLPPSDKIGDLKKNLGKISDYELLNIITIPKESENRGMIIFIYKQSQ
ncbi:hypothetical protein Mjas_00945 [Methanothermococcus sp. Ax23]|uniref:hypothetical protein n=1 Tax=Methanothermococcus sp. Ax23 TaxID=3156486 RepID=UPI003BA0BCB4